MVSPCPDPLALCALWVGGKLRPQSPLGVSQFLLFMDWDGVSIRVRLGAKIVIASAFLFLR